MTVVVAFRCTDGVVVAADSMHMTIAKGHPLAHHPGKKVWRLSDEMMCACAGNLGLADRFRFVAKMSYQEIQYHNDPIEYCSQISKALKKQFQTTDVPFPADFGAVYAYVHQDEHHCCVFDGGLQPRLLDSHHFYLSLGSGKLSADPFLRLLVDMFCPDGPPNVQDGRFLATWAVQYVIQTNPGGVAGPIRIGTIDRASGGKLVTQELPDEEVERHEEAIESAVETLRTWWEDFRIGDAAHDIPEIS